MNERIGYQKPSGNSSQVLKSWGLIFIAAGIIGRAIIENRVIHVMDMSHDELLAFMNASSSNFALVTSSMILKIASYCAVPLFLFLLVEGVTYTSSYRNYFLRIAGLALVTEIPYDLAIYDRAFYWKEQNPVFGLLLGLVIIFFFKTYAKGKLKSVLLYVFVLFLSIMWIDMLHISDGLFILILLTTLWLTRKNRRTQLYVTALVACFCVVLPAADTDNSIGSLVYLASPLSFLLVFRYNDEPGEGIRWVNYAAYPALLLSGWIVGRVLF